MWKIWNLTRKPELRLGAKVNCEHLLVDFCEKANTTIQSTMSMHCGPTKPIYISNLCHVAVLHGLLPTSLVGSYSLDTQGHFIGAVLKIHICISTHRHFIGAAICNLKSRIWNLKHGIRNLKSVIRSLRTEISNLKSEIWNLKSEIWILKSETSNPKSEIWNELAGPKIVNYRC